MNIALIIPTKDRPKDMMTLFNSIEKQIRSPDLVVVVDGSAESIKPVIDQFPQIKTLYVRVLPPSLPKQRNAGLQALPSDIDWVGFLDDDLVLEPDALQNMATFVEKVQSRNVRGIGLTILNQPTTTTHIFNSLFLIGSADGGRVTKSGFPSAIPPTSKDLSVNWLYGGATFWERSIFKNFRYDEWFQGTGYMEDVDFSFGVSQKYQLMICASAKCYHYHHPIHRSKQTRIGEWQFTSWWYFVRKYRSFSIPLVVWGMLGVFLKNALHATIRLSGDAGLRCVGNIKGALKIVQGRALQSTGFSK